MRVNYIEVVNLNVEDKTFVSWHTLGSLNIISTNMPENMILMYLESLRRNYDLLLEGCGIKGECLKPTGNITIINNEIRRQLTEIEEAENVRIIYAAEIDSKAMGFAPGGFLN